MNNNKFYKYFEIGANFHQHLYVCNSRYEDVIMKLIGFEGSGFACNGTCSHIELGRCPSMRLHFEMPDGCIYTGCPLIGGEDLRTYRVDDPNILGKIQTSINQLLEV